MKRKFSMFVNIAMLALSVCAIVIGVYSAKTAQLQLSGSIAFQAHDCKVKVSGTMAGVADKDGVTLKAQPSYPETLISTNSASWGFGKVYFNDIDAEVGEYAKPIIFTFTLSNESIFYDVKATINLATTLPSNVSQTMKINGSDASSGTSIILYKDKTVATVQVILNLTSETEIDDASVNFSGFAMQFVKGDIPELGKNGWDGTVSSSSAIITSLPTSTQLGGSVLHIPTEVLSDGKVVSVSSIGTDTSAVQSANAGISDYVFEEGLENIYLDVSNTETSTVALYENNSAMANITTAQAETINGITITAPNTTKNISITTNDNNTILYLGTASTVISINNWAKQEGTTIPLYGKPGNTYYIFKPRTIIKLKFLFQPYGNMPYYGGIEGIVSNGSPITELEVEAGMTWGEIVDFYNLQLQGGGTTGTLTDDNGTTIDIKDLGANYYFSVPFQYNGPLWNRGQDYAVQITENTDITFYYVCYLCLSVDTEITCYDEKKKIYYKKKLKDLTYKDKVLVWNFDEGRFDIAEPLFITKTKIATRYTVVNFSDGSQLKLIGENDNKRHRIFIKETGKFEYVNASCLGKTTFNEKGEFVKITDVKFVNGNIEYANIITKYHFNCFANGILTSAHLSNMYAIKDMKYVKEGRQLRAREEFIGIEDKYVEGLRLAEQPRHVSRFDGDNKYLNWIDFVESLKKQSK